METLTIITTTILTIVILVVLHVMALSGAAGDRVRVFVVEMMNV